MKNRLALIIGAVSVALALGAIFIGVYLSESGVCGGGRFRSDDCEFLWSRKWSAEGEDGDKLKISFLEDGGFFYSCSCGEHLQNYESYCEYTYAEDEKLIILHNYENEETSRLSVAYYDRWHLALRGENGAVTVFESEKAKELGEAPECAREYLERSPLPVTVKEEKDGVLTLLPYNYDGDAEKEFEGMVFQTQLSEDCRVASLYVTINNGDESFEYTEMSLEGAFETVDNSFLSANIGFNENGEVDSIVIYGVTEIWG